MTPTIHRRAEARLDLLQHFVYIGENNLDAARRFLTAAQDDCRTLARMPGMGAMREFTNPDLTGLRSWPIKGFEKYLIFYLPTQTGIDVLRVVHGAQDLNRIFEEST
ncbi:MAG: plasmid stabilization system [Phycisphaerales bacterium]|nr:plasmid stabilization system [Phycisphaerales bacterium]